MAVQVEVMVDHSQHVFTVKAESVVELPVEGDSITCGVCKKKKSKITKVGVPSRIPSKNDYRPSDPNQKSMLE